MELNISQIQEKYLTMWDWLCKQHLHSAMTIRNVC